MTPETDKSAGPLALLDYLEVGVFLLDAEQRIRVWNSWLARHSGFDEAAACGALLSEIFPDVADSRVQRAIDAALAQRMASLISPGLNAPPLALYQRPVDRIEGRRMRQLIHIVPFDTCGGCLVQVTDVTASARREDQLRHQSAELRERNYRDTLTGIGNRRRFDETVTMEYRRALRGGTAISLLMIDIDHFKSYNDAFGNPAGDACLKAVARLLADGLRDSGDVVARVGGEEFGVVLPGNECAGACQVAERLRRQVESSMANDPFCPVTVSIGVASIRPGAGSDTDSLVSGADVALYQAKGDGRNCVAFFDLDEGSLTTLKSPPA